MYDVRVDKKKNPGRQLSPEVILACVQTATTFGRVMDAHGGIPPGTLGIIIANVIVFIKVRVLSSGRLHTPCTHHDHHTSNIF